MAFVPLLEQDDSRFGPQTRIPGTCEGRCRGGSEISKGMVLPAPTPVSPPKRKLVRQKSQLDILLSQLRSRDEITRIYAASDLGMMGPRARRAVQPLIYRLEDKSKWVRRAAAKSLGKIGSRRAVQPLIRRLKDRDRYVAYTAARALQKIGTREALLAVRENERHWSL